MQVARSLSVHNNVFVQFFFLDHNYYKVKDESLKTLTTIDRFYLSHLF